MRLSYIDLNHGPQSPRTSQLNKSHKPSESTLRGQVVFLFSSFCIDLSTWPEILIQTQKDVIEIARTLPWPMRRKSREILSSITTLGNEMRPTWIPSGTKVVSLITSAKIMNKFHTTSSNWMTPVTRITAHKECINNESVIFPESPILQRSLQSSEGHMIYQWCFLKDSKVSYGCPKGVFRKGKLTLDFCTRNKVQRHTGCPWKENVCSCLFPQVYLYHSKGIEVDSSSNGTT